MAPALACRIRQRSHRDQAAPQGLEPAPEGLADTLDDRKPRKPARHVQAHTHQDALRLYQAKGFNEVARRPVVKEDWQVDAREWILFTKTL